MELVIDRFVLLLQAMSKYVECCSANIPGLTISQSSVSTSIGPIAKKYWTRVVQLCTALKQVQLENKNFSKKMPEFDISLALRSRRSSVESTDHISDSASGRNTASSLSHPVVASRAGSSASRQQSPGRDEYNKATQTVETAFVPCASCDAVHNSMRTMGDAVLSLCQSLNVTSSLDKHRARFDSLSWLSASDVHRWANEQNKDMASVGTHLKQLEATIDPLKADLESERKRSKELSDRAKKYEKEAALERDTSTTMRQQYEKKLKDAEKAKAATIVQIERQTSEFGSSKTELERQVAHLKSELDMCKDQLKQMELSKLDLIREMEQRSANTEHVESLQSNLHLLNTELADVSTKLREASVELNKEKARYSVANQHTVTVQSKQQSLLQRLDELDRDNNDLGLQVADLEGANERLQDDVRRLNSELERLLKAAREQNENNVNSVPEPTFSGEKAKLESEIEKLRAISLGLERQLSEAKENERLLVEYPDLHYNANNVGLVGTGNVADDMQNQIKANSLRINVLEVENAKLRTTVGKMLNVHAAAAGSGSDAAERLAAAMTMSTAPVQLRKYNSSDRTTVSDHVSAGGDSRLKHRPAGEVNYGDLHLEFQTCSHPEAPRSRPSQLTDQRAVRHSAKAKRATEITKKDRRNTASRSSLLPSGDDDDYYRSDETLTCPNCDKIYSSERDLGVHRSYCSGGL